MCENMKQRRKLQDPDHQLHWKCSKETFKEDNSKCSLHFLLCKHVFHTDTPTPSPKKRRKIERERVKSRSKTLKAYTLNIWFNVREKINKRAWYMLNLATVHT